MFLVNYLSCSFAFVVFFAIVLSRFQIISHFTFGIIVSGIFFFFIKKRVQLGWQGVLVEVEAILLCTLNLVVTL